jgi:ATP-dependent DNA ligase
VESAGAQVGSYTDSVLFLPPKIITPMGLSRRPEPFDNPDWLFELKWDGFRALAYVMKKVAACSHETEITSRAFTNSPSNGGTQTNYAIRRDLPALWKLRE